MPQSSKPRVALVVSEERKERWDQAVEDGHFDSMAELVRTSVSRELDGHHSFEASEQSGGSVQSAEQFEEVVSRLSSVESTLSELDYSVSQILEEAETEGRDYDVKQLVFERLPTVAIPDHGFEAREYEGEGAKTAEDIALEVPATLGEVQHALDELHGDSLVTKSDTDPAYYYTEP